jgi:hypothetical protein
MCSMVIGATFMGLNFVGLWIICLLEMLKERWAYVHFAFYIMCFFYEMEHKGFGSMGCGLLCGSICW